MLSRNLLLSSLVFSTCWLPSAAKAASFSGLNVFGDSLVDTGNLFNLTNSLLPGRGIPPSPPYAQRNSNGPIWIDQLGQALNLKPALITDVLNNISTLRPTEGINFAFAGSLSSDVHVLDDDLPFLAPLLPGLKDQVGIFAGLTPIIPVDEDALFIVLAGGNDYNEFFFNPASVGNISLSALPDTVTNNLATSIQTLAALGAKNFLIPNLPPLNATPFSDFLDAQSPDDVEAILAQFTTAHNLLLNQKLAAIAVQFPEVDFTLLDINTLLSDIIAHPADFGLSNVNDACLINFKPGFQFDGVCDHPEEFLFWDDVHPTTAAYKIVSDFALTTLDDQEPPSAAVPEPAMVSSVLLLGGWGMGRWATRRRLVK